MEGEKGVRREQDRRQRTIGIGLLLKIRRGLDFWEGSVDFERIF